MCYFERLFHFAVFRFTVVLLFSLGVASPALCGKIHMAAMNGDLEKVKEVVKENPDLISTTFGLAHWTPLHLAALDGHANVVEFLLANRADVNVKDSRGHTPMHLAVEQRHLDVVEVLRHYGGWDDSPPKGKNLRTASEESIGPRKPGAVEAIHEAAGGGDTAHVMELLKEDPDLVYSRDKDGMTVLHLAVLKASKDLVTGLLASQAEINAKNYNGETPLHLAVKLGNRDLVELLVSSGADVNAATSLEQTPMRLAANRNDEGTEDFLRLHGGLLLSPGERFGQIDKLFILPVVDARASKGGYADLKGMRKQVFTIMEKMHYAVVEANSAPADARWVMIITLREIDSVPTVTLAAVICDKDDKTPSEACNGAGGKFWALHGSAQQAHAGIPMTQASLVDLGLTGLMNGIGAGMALANATDKAVANLTGEIPDQIKK
jgi:ankyrin repeat protein